MSTAIFMASPKGFSIPLSPTMPAFKNSLRSLSSSSSSSPFSPEYSREFAQQLLNFDLNSATNSDSKVSTASATAPASTNKTICLLHPTDDFGSSYIEEIDAGLKKHAPRLISEGEGGAYQCFDQQKTLVGIFKPQDEEPTANNNPKSLSSSPPLTGSLQHHLERKGIKPGEGAIREVAAYLLDYGNFAGVPVTLLACINHSSFVNDNLKVGSLQQWIHHKYASWDLSSSKFNTNSVHRIALLDIRLFNTDRHGGNLLVDQTSVDGKHNLIPIDHGYCLPECLEQAYFEWLTWPQASEPLDQESIDYVAGLDVEKDAEILRELGFSSASILTMKISTLFLKSQVAKGKKLREIATFICRNPIEPQVPSGLEVLCDRVTDLCGGNEDSFFSALQEAFDFV